MRSALGARQARRDARRRSRRARACGPPSASEAALEGARDALPRRVRAPFVPSPCAAAAFDGLDH